MPCDGPPGVSLAGRSSGERAPSERASNGKCGPPSATFSATLRQASSEEAALAASSSCRAAVGKRPNDLLDRDLEASDDAGVAAPREELWIGITSRDPCISVFGVGDDIREAPGTRREDLSGLFGGVAERV